MFLKMKYSLFTAILMVTAMNPMIAIRHADAFVSCSNQLMVANQNAHAFRPNSMIAKKRMPRPLVGAMTQDDSYIFCFGLLLLDLPLFVCSRSAVLERFLTNGHEVCWSQPEITVLEFQDSHGLVNVIVLRCHHRICGVLLVSVSSLGCRP